MSGTSKIIFSPFLIDYFSDKFFYIRPRKLVALRKVIKLNDHDELVSSNFHFSRPFDHFKNPVKFVPQEYSQLDRKDIINVELLLNWTSLFKRDPIINTKDMAAAPRKGEIYTVLGMQTASVTSSLGYFTVVIPFSLSLWEQRRLLGHVLN